MADPNGNIGIRASDGGMRPVAILKKDNYKAWSSKMKSSLKVMDCWRMITGAEVIPPATAPVGSTGAERTASLALRASWDRAAAILITSISDDEIHTVQAVDEDPVQIWERLREKFERRSEAEAETAHMQLMDFTYREGESANATIDRFETAVKTCIDQGVAVDENLQKRMLLGRPAERYGFLKQSYLLAQVAARSNLVQLKAPASASSRRPILRESRLARRIVLMHGAKGRVQVVAED